MLVDPDSSCYWIAKRVFQGVILGNQDSQVLQQILPFSDAVFAVVNWESAHVSDYSGGQHNIAHNALCFHFIILRVFLPILLLTAQALEQLLSPIQLFFASAQISLQRFLFLLSNIVLVF